MKYGKLLKGLAAASALTIVAVACGDDGGGSSSGETTKVTLQLQWFAQAQFAGYYAAVSEGYYKAEGLDVTLKEGAVDIVPQTVLANGQADFALAWVPKALASREQGAGITNIAQIFERSATLQVAWADSGIKGPADLKGKKVGNWGFGNEYELFAGMGKAGLDPGKDVQLVQQQFDMKALLARDIDAAQAMTYNEYAQVLETKNPKTGELYKPEDLTVINWNDVGTAMLQDAIWADTKKLEDKDYKATAEKFVRASVKGWVFCRDNPEKCADIVTAAGSKLGKTHQLWMMNEINKLIWPSTGGIGMISENQWKQTVTVALNTKNAEGKTVITKEPDAVAHTNDVITKVLADLEKDKVDTKGADFKPITVTLTENGA